MWNAVEKIEKAANSQLAREIELALPKELSLEQNIYLIRKYVKDNFVDSGMCADLCIHDKGDRIPIIDETTRLQKLDGRNRKQWKRVYVQINDWNEQTKAEEWRAAWETYANAALEKYCHESRIDHRSFKRQGIEQIPTIHMGVAATQMEQRGIVTDRGNINREIKHTNNLLRQIWEKIKQLKDWLKQVLTPAAPLTLYEILQGVLESSQQRDRYGKIRDLKTVERVFTFMGENGISTLPELREKYSDALSRYDNARQKVGFYEQAEEKGKVYREYNATKALFSEVEAVRLNAENIARQAARNLNSRERETQSRGLGW